MRDVVNAKGREFLWKDPRTESASRGEDQAVVSNRREKPAHSPTWGKRKFSLDQRELEGIPASICRRGEEANS